MNTEDDMFSEADGIEEADESGMEAISGNAKAVAGLGSGDDNKNIGGSGGRAPGGGADGKKLSRRERRRLKRAEQEQLIRIQELEELMAKSGGDVNPETIVSMYVPHRKRRQIGAALLRMDKWRLALLGLLLVVCITFIIAFMQEKMGNFTINLNRLELYRKGISIAESGDFKGATARLKADAVQDATNISIADIPEDVDSIEGSHNGKNYMAYTYYIRNAGKEDLGYVARVTLDSCAKGAEEAVRVAVWRNGQRIVYAEPAADGSPEDGCENFKSDSVVCEYTEDEFLVGNVDRYTIAIWMEGDDPECVDSIIGGSVQFSMHIDADYDDESSLLWKFVTDIKDTLTGDKPISAAGNEAPNGSYYGDREVTWDTRRNQDNEKGNASTDDQADDDKTNSDARGSGSN